MLPNYEKHFNKFIIRMIYNNLMSLSDLFESIQTSNIQSRNK